MSVQGYKVGDEVLLVTQRHTRGQGMVVSDTTGPLIGLSFEDNGTDMYVDTVQVCCAMCGNGGAIVFHLDNCPQKGKG